MIPCTVVDSGTVFESDPDMNLNEKVAVSQAKEVESFSGANAERIISNDLKSSLKINDLLLSTDSTRSVTSEFWDSETQNTSTKKVMESSKGEINDSYIDKIINSGEKIIPFPSTSIVPDFPDASTQVIAMNGRILKSCVKNNTLKKTVSWSKDALFLEACRYSDVEEIKNYFKMGFLVNKTTLECYPLIVAVQDDNYTLIEYFLSIGADPNVYDKSLETALHIASFQGNLKTLQILLTSSSINIAQLNGEEETALENMDEDEVEETKDAIHLLFKQFKKQ